MAKIKLSAFMDNISGKVNGTVFSSNRGGAYVRSKGKVVKFKPGSDLSDTVNLGGVPTVQSPSPQSAVLAILSGVSKAWSALAGFRRTAWNNAVEDWKSTDVFGDARTPSGSQLYTKLNSTRMNLMNHRLDMTTQVREITMPPIIRLPLVPLESAHFLVVAGNSSATPAVAPVMTLFGGSQAGVTPLSDSNAFLIEMTRPMSAGKYAVGNSDFRQIWVDNQTARTNSYMGSGYAFNDDTRDGLLLAYQARFGVDMDVATNPGIVGSKIFVRITPVSLKQGTKGVGQVFSCLLAPSV